MHNDHPARHAPALPGSDGDASRRAFVARHAVALAALALVGACGGGSGSGSADAAGASIYFPVPVNVFGANVDSGNSTFPARVSLTLTPLNPLTSNGAFVGSSLRVTLFTGLSDNHRVTGSHTGENVTIFVESAVSPIASSYSGGFIDRDTLRLVPTDGSGRPTLTLQRAPASD